MCTKQIAFMSIKPNVSVITVECPCKLKCLEILVYLMGFILLTFLKNSVRYKV